MRIITMWFAHARLCLLAAGCLLAGGSSPVFAAGVPELVVTNLAQLRHAVSRVWRGNAEIRIEGVICAVNPARHVLVLQDDSGAELLELDPAGCPGQAGQRVLLEGQNCQVTRTIYGVRLGRPPVVDNDGLHGMTEQSGALELPAGRTPLRLLWFNRNDLFGLELFQTGPGQARGRIADQALFRANGADPADNRAATFAPGLNYRCFEGSWTSLPDFNALVPVKTGTVTNFDLAVATRPDRVALEFSGLLEVPRAGRYTFWTVSDDGSQLFIGTPLPRLEVIGQPGVPTPRHWDSGTALPAATETAWVQLEGNASFVASHGPDLELELRTPAGPVPVRVLGGGDAPVALWRDNRLRVVGVAQRTLAPAGRPDTVRLMVAGAPGIELLSVRAEAWNMAPRKSIAAALAANSQLGAQGAVVRLAGQVRSVSAGRLGLADASGEASLETSNPPAEGSEIEVLAQWSESGTNVPPRALFWREPAGVPAARRELTTAEEVHRLKPEEARRQHPVRIRGVVTCDDPELFRGFFIQDATRGIFVSHRMSVGGDRPRMGELWEIEGRTGPGDFAPVIEAQKMTRLGLGRLPEPEHPTWDQLMTGSLDAQYVELQGIATATRGESMTLLLHGGTTEVRFSAGDRRDLSGFANALIRIRGTLRAVWDKASRQVRVGEVWIGNPAIGIDQAAPADPFKVPAKSVRELLLFDPQAATLQRVKVIGQFVAQRAGQCFALDGTNGWRFMPATTNALCPGDWVEVVGLPDLSGLSATLRAAVVRTTRRAVVPPAVALPADDLMEAYHDATRVTVQATLMEERQELGEQVLQMQSGYRVFLARLNNLAGRLPALAPGSRLTLTGVCAGQGPRSVSGQMDAFELLLGSPRDVAVLARPPWWSLQRLLAILGALLGVLALAAVWIALLHRRVEQRTAQLQREIRARQLVEQERLLEAERARIARDLHDDLGSSLTEIGVLAATGARAPMTEGRSPALYHAIAHKARGLIAAMDVIVWAVNPEENSVQSLADYLSAYVSEYLAVSGLACRFRIPVTLPPITLDGRTRHDLFLAVKETLHNVVRHAQATEAEFKLELTGSDLAITITDNGIGFDPATVREGHGLRNLTDRLRKLGGRYAVASLPRRGTVVTLYLPLPTQVPSGDPS